MATDQVRTVQFDVAEFGDKRGNDAYKILVEFVAKHKLTESDIVEYLNNGVKTGYQNSAKSIVFNQDARNGKGNWNGTLRVQVTGALSGSTKTQNASQPANRQNKPNRNSKKFEFVLNLESGIVTLILAREPEIMTVSIDVCNNKISELSLSTIKLYSKKLAIFANDMPGYLLSGIECDTEFTPIIGGWKLGNYASEKTNEKSALDEIMKLAQNASDTEFITKHAIAYMTGTLKCQPASQRITDDFIAKYMPAPAPAPASQPAPASETPADKTDIAQHSTPADSSQPAPADIKDAVDNTPVPASQPNNHEMMTVNPLPAPAE